MSTLIDFVDKSTRKYQNLLAECLLHLEFVCQLIVLQIVAGRLFLLEHPWSAWSWWLSMVEKIMAYAGVILVRGDQCPFDQEAVGRHGPEGLAQKASGWLTNSPEIAEVVCLRPPHCIG